MNLYGFIGAHELEAAAEIEAGPVRFVPGPGIAAMVADGSGSLTDDLLAHHHTLARLSEELNLVPVAVGTEVDSEEDLAAVLAHERDRVLRLLETFDGCVEANVRATYSEDAVLPALTEGLERPVNGGDLAGQIRLGEAIKRRLDALAASDAVRLLDALARLSVDHRLGRRGDWTVMDASFLVRRENREAFEERLEAINVEEGGRIGFRLSIPLPPYSFLTDQVSQ